MSEGTTRRKIERRHVLWLMTTRLVVVSTLFVAALILHIITDVAFPLIIPLFYLIVFVYAISIVYLLIYAFFPSRAAMPVFVFTQLIGDIIGATWLVYLTGGVESSFSFLYHIPIIASSVLLYRKGALAMASASAIAYGGLADLIYYGFIPPFKEAHFLYSMPILYYYLAVNMLGFFLVAVLSSHITERYRRKTEELEKASYELATLRIVHRNVIDSMGSGLIAIGFGGAVEFINRTGLAILGIKFQDAVEKNINDILPSFPITLSAQTQNYVTHCEFSYSRPDGERRSLGASVALLRDPEGNPEGWTLIFDDLTDMKEMERKLRFKERMSALGEMAAGFAHEIRNPLASIRGSAQLLKGDARIEATDKKLLEIIVKETDRLNRTIEAFLHYARGGVEQNFARTDVVRVIRDAVALVRNSEQCKPEHEISLVGNENEFFCFVDPDQIKQVVWNLVLNALQAMPDGGTLAVSVNSDGDEKIAIVFEDTGTGIPEEEIQNIFMPFKRRFSSGMGLGLFIAYQIVESYKGAFNIESEIGRGTRVYVRLPRHNDMMQKV